MRITDAIRQIVFSTNIIGAKKCLIKVNVAVTYIFVLEIHLKF